VKDDYDNIAAIYHFAAKMAVAAYTPTPEDFTYLKREGASLKRHCRLISHDTDELEDIDVRRAIKRPRNPAFRMLSIDLPLESSTRKRLVKLGQIMHPDVPLVELHLHPPRVSGTVVRDNKERLQHLLQKVVDSHPRIYLKNGTATFNKLLNAVYKLIGVKIKKEVMCTVAGRAAPDFSLVTPPVKLRLMQFASFE
jgi:hypothetical protein